MELRDFIAHTLVEIIEGVKDAQGKTSTERVSVNPLMIPREKEVRNVQFDVALSISESGDNKVGIGVLSVFNFGASMSNTSTEGSVTRVQFEIPLMLPTTDMPR